MRLPTTLQNNREGFLVYEVMIAFSLMTLFIISTIALKATMQELHLFSIKRLENLKSAVSGLASSSQGLYGNDTKETKIGPLTILSSDYDNAWGRDSCKARFPFGSDKIKLYFHGIDLGLGNLSTHVEARHGFVYLTADSAVGSASDFYIIDARSPTSSQIISSLDTGPGLSSLEVAGTYVYATNTGRTNQLQVIDISNRSSPVIIAKLKLPLPNASSTAPAASTIFYHQGFVYLGTQKWEGNEFSVIDVSNPFAPQYVGGFETNTLVNDIYVRDGLAYLATADEGQMRILDVHNPSSIIQLEYFSPSGWETQEGKIISYFEGKFGLGRTTGGFNVVSNHEIFSFSSTSPLVIEMSYDLLGGIYGMVIRPEMFFLGTRLFGREFQVWKQDFSEKLFEFPLGFFPRGLSCDGTSFYFATGDSTGVAVLTLE
ncbi:MAG: hypothetical protein AAB917_01480 [Patescibacteria group bacterium]